MDEPNKYKTFELEDGEKTSIDLGAVASWSSKGKNHTIVKVGWGDSKEEWILATPFEDFDREVRNYQESLKRYWRSY